MECRGLRVQDVDFTRNEITVRDGKGRKDRLTMLPSSLKGDLIQRLERARTMHQRDLTVGYGSGSSRKGEGGAIRRQESRDHVDESIVQRAVSAAVIKVGLTKRASCHTSAGEWLRHSHNPGVARARGHHGLAFT